MRCAHICRPFRQHILRGIIGVLSKIYFGINNVPVSQGGEFREGGGV